VAYDYPVSPQRLRDIIQLVFGHVDSANGYVERRLSKLRPRRVTEGLVYMVHESSPAAATSRHSRPEPFNDIARQNIGCPHRILQDCSFDFLANG
jgi:hypothetical protein